MSLDLSHLRVAYRVNTKTHVSFSLPDRRHCVEIYMSEHSVHCKVYEDHSLRIKQDFALWKKKTPDWENLLHQFCELAVKKYPKELQHKTSERRSMAEQMRYNRMRGYR